MEARSFPVASLAPAGQPLRDWTEKNRRAVATRDRTAMAAIAIEFDSYIRAQLDARRDGTVVDNTARLLAERVDGRPLSDEEIVSTIRNWTVAELSTIAASAGVVAAHLARHPEVQEALRIDPKAIEPGSGVPVTARFPAGGFDRLPLRLR